MRNASVDGGCKKTISTLGFSKTSSTTWGTGHKVKGGGEGVGYEKLGVGTVFQHDGKGGSEKNNALH